MSYADPDSGRRRASRNSLVVTAAIHVAVIGAIVLIPPAVRQITPSTPLIATNVPEDPFIQVPVDPVPQQTEDSRETIIERTDPPIVIPTGPITPITGPIDPPTGPAGPIIGSGEGTGSIVDPIADPTPAPVIVEPSFRSRTAVQPAYPAAEARLNREGSVRIRVLVGADGRVREARRLSATSDAFWRATEKQALDRWRFDPGTEDGRPVDRWYTVTVTFELN